MDKEDMKRVVDRVKIKELIRRQAIIKPDESMYSGVDPIEYAAFNQRVLPNAKTVTRRVLILETWIEKQRKTKVSILSPMPVPPKKEVAEEKALFSVCKLCGERLASDEDLESGICLECEEVTKGLGYD